MRELRRLVVVLIAPASLASLASLAIGCSSSSSSSSPACNENPWECPSGQTCWPENPSSFACLNSGLGKAGDPCEDSVGAATCGDGLACLRVGTGIGTCSPFCDSTNPSHGCPTGAMCRMAALVGAEAAQFQVCVSTSMATTDAGDDSSSSASDAFPPSE